MSFFRMLLALGLVPALACQPQAESDPTPLPTVRAQAPALPTGAVLPPGVLVTVNGHPITETDVRLALKQSDPEAPVEPAQRERVLETLIGQELVAQQAAALGLTQDPDYQTKLARLQAALDAFRRGALGDAFYREEVERKAVISDAEARQHFEANAARLRTELHVHQLLLRDAAAANEALAQLRDGKPFEAVARQQFPQLPPGGDLPWDLGWLKPQQVPEPWRAVVYDLKPGQTSEIIAGPKQRFWLVRVVDRREKTDLRFEDVRGAVIDELKGSRLAALRTQADDELRRKARIERVPYRAAEAGAH